MDLPAYRALQTQATRLTRSAADAEDLLQDALLIALQASRDDLPWLIGVLQNQAAMQARSAVRRRAREETVSLESDAPRASDDTGAHPRENHSVPLLQRLAPAARRVALLALHGLDAEEIRWILGVSPAAFRQRLTSIRKALGALPPAQRAEALALAYVRDPARSADLQFGLIRRALKSALHGDAGLGTHDPDGHLIVIRCGAHTFASRGNE